jgi:hypothetical protein
MDRAGYEKIAYTQNLGTAIIMSTTLDWGSQHSLKDETGNSSGTNTIDRELIELYANIVMSRSNNNRQLGPEPSSNSK